MTSAARTGILMPAVILLSFLNTHAQTFTQTVKGVVLDKSIKNPLVGATVHLVPQTQADPAQPSLGAVTGLDGRFRIAGVPVGLYTIQVHYIGYREFAAPNVAVNSGKETDLVLELEESVLQSKEVVIRAAVEKEKPLNELSIVSARPFSVEETRRFAAAVNDPGRMASAYAGVVTRDDGENTIIIRGNAPNGLLWRMEGVDIPNPNHFSAQGTSGGGISIISAQLLGNSDFLTGAFAAEYGNALSGVFDLRLRKGNPDKYEYTLQAGFLGLDAAAEGPLRLGRENGSFLFNYRYSTLSLLSKIGIQIGDAPTDFQDLSYNVYLPAGKAGAFTLFGFGGLSAQTTQGVADSILWDENWSKKYHSRFGANTGVMGFTHTKVWEKTSLKTVLALSGARNSFWEDEYEEDYRLVRNYDRDFTQQKHTLSTVLSHKFNPRHYLRAGVYTSLLAFDFKQYEWDDEQDRPEEQIREEGQAATFNAFAQWQYRPTEKLTLLAGLHSFYLDLSRSLTAEPRAAVQYALNKRQSIRLGYGRHTQMQPLGVYFVRINDGQPNRSLTPTQADHYVLAFDQMLPANLHVKLEAYYQDIRRAPVDAGEANAFSMLNVMDGFVYRPLTNAGRGRNYGLELTFEKFLTEGLYFLLSSSLYESKYRGSDGVWRNGRFNGRYANSLVAGKEWSWKRNRAFGLNVKLTQLGGLRETPIDLVASRQAGETVRDDARAFEDQLPAYFRFDLGLRLKRNRPGLTTTLALDVQNATNRANVFGRYYNADTFEAEYVYQMPVIPVLSYRLEF